jgi:tRNA G26 N,N-dimethylase Trm1
MSHFTTIKVQIKNSEILHQVLQELGYQVECNTTVRGDRGNTTDAEYVIRQQNGYDIGFRRNGESYEVVADFWGAKINQQQFVNSITQKYAHKTLIATIQEQGFNLEEEEVTEDGTVRVVVGRWV